MTTASYIFPGLCLLSIIGSFIWVSHLLSNFNEENLDNKIKRATSILDERIRIALSYLYFLKMRSGSENNANGGAQSREELMTEIRYLNNEIELAYTRMSDEVCIVENDELLEILTSEYDLASRELRDIEETFETIFLES